MAFALAFVAIAGLIAMACRRHPRVITQRERQEALQSLADHHLEQRHLKALRDLVTDDDEETIAMLILKGAQMGFDALRNSRDKSTLTSQ